MTAARRHRLSKRTARQMGLKGGATNTPAQTAARIQNAVAMRLARQARRRRRLCRTCGETIQQKALDQHNDCGLWTWSVPLKAKGAA